MEFLEAYKRRKGYMMFIPVTLNCNLNCYGCYTGCAIDRKNVYELDINTFDATLSKVNEICVNCDGFILTGGEPLLSKNFMHICRKLKQYCPDKSITIYTNGTLFHTLSDSDLDYLIKNRVVFSFSYYPDKEMLSKTLDLMTQLEAKGASIYLHDRSRPYFLKTTCNTETIESRIFDATQAKEPNREIGCGHRHETNFTLMDDKIFGCDGAIMLKNLRIPFNEQNYIAIDDLQSENQMFQLKYNSDMCLKCKNEGVGNPYIIWHTQKELGVTNGEDEKCLMDIFCYEYEKYKKLQDNNEKLLGVINNPYFDFGMVRYDLHYGYTKYYTRYLQGNIDICIVFNEKNIPDWETLLIIKDEVSKFIDPKNNNLYVICDNLTIEQQQTIYKVFVPTQIMLNTYLIKCDKYQDGIQYFLDNSFSPHYCIFNNITVRNCKNFENMIKNPKKRE